MFNFLSFGSLLLLALSVDAVIHGHGGRHAPSRGRSHAVVPRDGLSNDGPLVERRAGQLARHAAKRCGSRPTSSLSSSSSSSPPLPSPVVPGNVAGDPSPPTPTTTKNHHVAPVPQASPTSSAPPKAGSPKSVGTPLLAGVKSGQGTFYNTGLDACGNTDSDSDLIAAASFELFDIFPGATENPNLNPICGRTVTASFGGKSVTVRIVDRCAGCQGKFDLDFSPAAFNALADPNLGRIDITWRFD